MNQKCNDMNGILSITEKEKTSGETIYKRCINRYYVNQSATMGEMTEVFIENKYIEVITVTDDNIVPIGVIERQELLCIVGQKFGRELHTNKPLLEFATAVDSVYYKKNTFSVVDEISDYMKKDENRYIVLVNNDKSFKGLTSTRELKRFLSLMMTRDINAARDVQKAIVKSDISHDSENFSFSASSRMAGGIGGDFHFFRRLDDERSIIAICDVSGKGIKASLISVSIGGMFNSFNFNEGLERFISLLNSFIYGLFNGEIFVTGIFIEFNEITGDMFIYDMGHSLIYLKKENKIVRIKTADENFPLGIVEDVNPVKKIYSIQPGEILISVTDGIIEQTDINNNDFGEERFSTIIMKYHNKELTRIKEDVYRSIKEFKFGQTQVDDMTLFLLRYR